MSNSDWPDTSIVGWKIAYGGLSYKDFEWVGFCSDDGLHMFQRGDHSAGFTVVKCRDSELFDRSDKDGRSSFQMMVDAGLTR